MLTPDQGLHAVQRDCGAVFPEAGHDTSLAAHFGDPKSEYHSAGGHAALFDLSDRSQIRVTGQDRQSFLHNFCTNDIRALQAGQGCEAFVTNAKGRILAHIFVFAGDEAVWIETVPGAAGPLIAHWRRYCITEDARIDDQTSVCGELLVAGPQAAEVVAAISPDAAPLSAYGHRQSIFRNDPLSVRRVDWLGVPGFLLSVPRERLADLWNAVVASGARPAGTAAFQAMRIEAIFPLYGQDITDENLGQEPARTSLAISFKKGCYLGQEPIARIQAIGHVNRELRGLRLDSEPVPKPSSRVIATDQDKPIGQITSATLSFADDRPVALAYLRSAFAAPGTRVNVETDAGAVAATIALCQFSQPN